MYETYDKDSQGGNQLAQFAFNHLGLTPVDSGDTEVSTVDVKPYIRKHLIVGKDFMDVDRLEL